MIGILAPLAAIPFQLAFFARGRRAVGSVSDLESIDRESSDDIISRSRMGIYPDWPTYDTRLHASHDESVDEARNYAAACLATGLGGTLLGLLLAHGLVGDEEAAIQLGWSLSSSFLGVGLSVWLSTRSVSVFTAEFERRFAQIETGLREIARTNPPVPPSADTLRQQMEALSRVVTETLSTLPKAVTALARELHLLIPKLGTEFEQLRTEVGRLHDATERVGKAHITLAEFSRQILAQSDELKSAPDRIGKAFEGALKPAMDSFREEGLKLAQQWKHETEQAMKNQHQLETENRTLWQGQVSTIVRNTLATLTDHTREQLHGCLNEVATSLRATSEHLAAQPKSLLEASLSFGTVVGAVLPAAQALQSGARAIQSSAEALARSGNSAAAATQSATEIIREAAQIARVAAALRKTEIQTMLALVPAAPELPPELPKR